MGQQGVQVGAAQQRPQRRLRDLRGGHRVVLHGQNRFQRIGHLEHDDGVDAGRHVVAGDHLLGRDGQRHQPLVDPDHLVHQRNQKPKSRLVQRTDMAHPEDHSALVFAQHGQRDERQHDERQRRRMRRRSLLRSLLVFPGGASATPPGGVAVDRGGHRVLLRRTGAAGAPARSTGCSTGAGPAAAPATITSTDAPSSTSTSAAEWLPISIASGITSADPGDRSRRFRDGTARLRSAATSRPRG